jgi:Glycosyl transferases group 1/Glycosyl transferase 4-like domain
MKLLFATSLLPRTEASSGYEIANRAILHGLRAIGHEVVAIGYSDSASQAIPSAPPVSNRDRTLPNSDISLGEIDVVTANASAARKVGWLARAVRQSTTFAAAKLRVVDDATLTNAITKAGPFDAIILNGAPMAAAFERVLTGQPFIYIAHNVEWRSALESAAAANGTFERALFQREARFLKALEQRMAQRASHVFTLSQEDADIFASLGAVSVSTIPLVASLEVQPMQAAEKLYDAGLIGTWSWAPNRIGLDWFLNDVTPHLPGDFSFAIAGTLPNAPLITHSRGKSIGRVESALDFVRSCRVLPLVSRAGSGVQLKTLEAFELGQPTVATTLSLRGINAVPDNCVIADNPRLFADALVKAARAIQPASNSGHAFHAAQMARMLTALDLGLKTRQPQTPSKLQKQSVAV